MGIDWKAGEITDDQHIMHPDQLTPMVKELEVRDVAYIDAENLSAGSFGALWLDPDADIYTEEEVTQLKDDVDFCRVIKTEKGLIIDASAGSFKLDLFESEETIPVDTSRNHEEEGWLPVVGLIGSDMEREAIGTILFDEHDIVLGRSILLPPLEFGSDDIPGGDEGLAT